MWMSKNAHVYFQPSGHHGVPINGTQATLKELKHWFAIFHMCFYYWLAIEVTWIAIRDVILIKMFPVPQHNYWWATPWIRFIHVVLGTSQQ